MTPEQRVYAGDRARELLENEVFQQVWTDYKQEITEQWMKSPARDEEGREKLWLMLQMLNKLQSMVQTTLDSGKMARLDLDHKTRLQRTKELIGLA